MNTQEFFNNTITPSWVERNLKHTDDITDIFIKIQNVEIYKLFILKVLRTSCSYNWKSKESQKNTLRELFDDLSFVKNGNDLQQEHLCRILKLFLNIKM